jgi:hypothetical protein
MKFSWIATLALFGAAMAMPAKQEAKVCLNTLSSHNPGDANSLSYQLPSGAPCTKDGKMGICESNVCIVCSSTNRYVLDV